MTKSGPTKTGPSGLVANNTDEDSSVSTPFAPVPSIASTELLGVRGELKILHNGEMYSLRRTRQGKLILTK